MHIKVTCHSGVQWVFYMVESEIAHVYIKNL